MYCRVLVILLFLCIDSLACAPVDWWVPGDAWVGSYPWYGCYLVHHMFYDDISDISVVL
jgi:hypothetical protein